MGDAASDTMSGQLFKASAVAMGRVRMALTRPAHIHSLRKGPASSCLALSAQWHKQHSHQHQHIQFSSKSTIAAQGVPLAKEEEEEKVKAPVQHGRMRTLLNRYGAVFVGTYGSVYFITLGSLYGAYSFGGLEASDIADITDGVSALDRMLIYMDYLTFPVEYIELIRSNPKAGNYTVGCFCCRDSCYCPKTRPCATKGSVKYK